MGEPTMDVLAGQVKRKAQGSMDCAFWMVVAEALQQRCDAIAALRRELEAEKARFEEHHAAWLENHQYLAARVRELERMVQWNKGALPSHPIKSGRALVRIKREGGVFTRLAWFVDVGPGMLGWCTDLGPIKDEVLWWKDMGPLPEEP